MITQYTKQLGYSEGARIEVGSQIFSQTDNLGRGQARHGCVERLDALQPRAYTAVIAHVWNELL